MPRVTMPDGAVVDMPDELTPELATRLKALRDSGSAPAPVQGVIGGTLPPANPTDSAPITRKKSKLAEVADYYRNLASYAGDVVQRPSSAIGKALAQVTGDKDFEFRGGVPLISSPQEVQADRAKLDPVSAMVTDVAANPLTYVVPGGGTTLPARMARGAVTGNVLPPRGPDAPPEGVAGATALGGIMPAAAEGVGRVVSRVGNAIKGALPTGAAAVQALGDKFGVRVFAPDMSKTPGLAKTGTLIESVPGSGMVKDRLAQQADALKAAQELLAKHGIQGDTGTTIQQGLANKLAQGKANSTAAYDLVGQLSQGKGDVPLANTLGQIQKFKAEISSSALPDEGLLGLLGKMEARLTDPKAGVDKTYQGVRGLRSDLGSMISDYYKGTNAATGSKGVGILQGIKNGIEDDLEVIRGENPLDQWVNMPVEKPRRRAKAEVAPIEGMAA